jgi:hypothetical protein
MHAGGSTHRSACDDKLFSVLQEQHKRGLLRSAGTEDLFRSLCSGGRGRGGRGRGRGRWPRGGPGRAPAQTSQAPHKPPPCDLGAAVQPVTGAVREGHSCQAEVARAGGTDDSAPCIPAAAPCIVPADSAGAQAATQAAIIRKGQASAVSDVPGEGSGQAAQCEAWATSHSHDEARVQAPGLGEPDSTHGDSAHGHAELLPEGDQQDIPDAQVWPRPVDDRCLTGNQLVFQSRRDREGQRHSHRAKT